MVKPELKEQAEAVFDAIGLSMGDAIRLFLIACSGLQNNPYSRISTYLHL